MQISTQCYIKNGGDYLMLYRNKKPHDVNRGKWIGVGGKLEPGEAPEECVRREVREETGLEVTDYKLAGFMTFIYEDRAPEYIFIYTARALGRAFVPCDEGTLAWVPAEKIAELPLWDGDRLYIDHLIKGHEYFSIKLTYSARDELLDAQFL